MDSSRRSPSRETQPRVRPQNCHRPDLPERLRARLAQRGLSQAKLSQHTSIDQSLLSKILNGKRRPTAAQLGALAHVLDIDFGELLTLPPPPKELTELRSLRAERDDAVRRADEAEAAHRREEIARARAESAAADHIAEIASLRAERDEAVRRADEAEAAYRSEETARARAEQELAAAKLRLGEFEFGSRPRASKDTSDRSRERPDRSHSTVELVDVASQVDEHHARIRRNRDMIESVGQAFVKWGSAVYFCHALAQPRR